MFKILVGLFCVVLTILGNLGAHKNGSVKTTTAKPILQSFLDNFHQSDYKMKYEWSETVRVNKRYLDYTKIVFKYNRTTTALNFTVSVHVDMGYDVEIVVQAYKFASNEYRLFPMRFQANLCEGIGKDVLGGSKFSKCGNFSCPLLKGKSYIIRNWSPDEAHFPPFIPTGRYMTESQYMFQSTEVLVTRNYINIYRLLF